MRTVVITGVGWVLLALHLVGPVTLLPGTQGIRQTPVPDPWLGVAWAHPAFLLAALGFLTFAVVRILRSTGRTSSQVRALTVVALVLGVAVSWRVLPTSVVAHTGHDWVKEWRAIPGEAGIRLEFPRTAYVGMPVWVHVTVPESMDGLSQPNMRYPYIADPVCFGPEQQFEVRYRGEPLEARSWMLNNYCQREFGSVAPLTSPRFRFPLHMWFDFAKPGRYEVRSLWHPRSRTDTRAPVASAWTELRVRRYSRLERLLWRQAKRLTTLGDPGRIVGDYLPSILVSADDHALQRVLAYQHHSEGIVRAVAREGLDLFDPKTILREIPRLIERSGPTEELAYFLSWKREILRPAGERLATALMASLDSDDPVELGAAIRGLGFMKARYFDEESELPRRMDKMVFDRTDRFLSIGGTELLQPLAIYAGSVDTEAARTLLWNIVRADRPERESASRQALIVLGWKADPRDLEPLLERLIAGHSSLAYAMRGYGDAVRPHLVEALRRTEHAGVRKAIEEQLVWMDAR